jgi:hypothetical protein
MKRLLLPVAVIVLIVATPAQATRFEKQVFLAPEWLRMDTARHVALAWARRDVRNGWATGYSRPRCKRLASHRVRCDVRQYGLRDSYNPRRCRGALADPRADCQKVARSWPFTLYIARRHGCVSLWVWDFERFACWRD